MGPDTTESEIRNRFPASGDCESTQIGRTPTNIGDYDVARDIHAVTNAEGIYCRYNRRQRTRYEINFRPCLQQAGHVRAALPSMVPFRNFNRVGCIAQDWRKRY